MLARAALVALIPFIIDSASAELSVKVTGCDFRAEAASVKDAEYVFVFDVPITPLSRWVGGNERRYPDRHWWTWSNTNIGFVGFAGTIDRNIPGRLFQRESCEKLFDDSWSSSIILDSHYDRHMTINAPNVRPYNLRIGRVWQNNGWTTKHNSALQIADGFLPAQNLEVADDYKAIGEEGEKDVSQSQTEWRLWWLSVYVSIGGLIAFACGAVILVLDTSDGYHLPGYIGCVLGPILLAGGMATALFAFPMVYALFW